MADAWSTPPTPEETGAAGGWDTPPTPEEMGEIGTTPAPPPASAAAPATPSGVAAPRPHIIGVRDDGTAYDQGEKPQGHILKRLDDGSVVDEASQPAPHVLRLAEDGRAVDETEEQEVAADARIKALFDVGLTKNPDRHAGVLEVAKKTGAPVDVVEQRFDDFKRSAEASKFDPRTWRRANPELARILDEQPHLAPVVIQDEKVGAFTKALREMQRVGIGGGALGPLSDQVGGLGGLILGALDPTTIMGPTAGVLPRLLAGVKPEQAPKQVAYQPKQVEGGDPLGAALKESFLPSAIGAAIGETQTWKIARDAFGRRRKQSELSTLGSKQWGLDALLAQSEKLGEQNPGDPAVASIIASDRAAAYENEKAILRLKDELGPEPDYGIGSVAQSGLDALDALASQVDAFEGYAGGAVAGGLIGAAATRSLAGARVGAEVGIKLGGFASTFNQEGGQAYLEFRDMKDADGKPMDRDIAMGAAALYGLAAAGVEVATIGPTLRAFGPIGEVLAGGNGEIFARSALADASKRQALKDIGAKWAESTVAEGGEEGVQQFLQWLSGYAGQSISASKLQPVDADAVRNDIVEATGKGMLGGALLGGVGSVVSLAQESMKIDAEAKAGARIAEIVKLADSPSVRAAPEVMAKVIEAETQRSGQKVTHLYIDPMVLSQALEAEGLSPEQGAQQLLGENGPERMRVALGEFHDSPGQRATLEVPVAEFLEKFGPKPIAAQLVDHMATRPSHMTQNELRLYQGEIQKLADQLVAIDQANEETEGPAGVDIPIGPNEAALTQRLEKQLVETGRVTVDEARKSVAMTRAFLRTMAKRSGQAAEQVFGNYSLSVQDDINARPQASQQLSEQLAAMTPDERDATMWLDKNTGLLNARAFRALKAPEGKPLVAHFSIEGTKFVNKAGHTPGNQLYRLAGQALRDLAADAAKYGGDFVASVATPEEAQGIADKLAERIRDKLRELNPDADIRGLEVTATTTARGEDVGASVKAASGLNAEEKARREAAGTRAKRGERPLGVPLEDPAKLALPTEDAAQRAVPDELRKQSKKMTDDQVLEAVYLDKSTGMLSGEAFFALPKKKHVVSIDLNGLRQINDELGEHVGDFVLQEFGRMARLAGASGLDMAHLSGDEYAAQTDDAALAQYFVDILGELAQTIKVRFDDGSKRGVTFGYGIGSNYDAADKLVEQHKERERLAAERGEPSPEAEARRGRDRNRRSGDSDTGPRGRESIARGDQAQGPSRVRQRHGRRDRQARAAADAQRRGIIRARLEALREGSSEEVARKLAQLATPESDAAAGIVAAKLLPVVPKFESKERAWRTLLDESGIGETPSGVADFQYGRALAGLGEMPEPFPGGTFDVVNEHLGLKGNKRVVGAQHAFDLLTKGARSFEAVEAAVEILRQVPGLEALRMPQDYIARQAEEKASANEREREADALNRGEAADDDIEDPDTGFEFYQPAWHGTPHRGIEKFSLDKIGTGEGAQSYGWGLYFTDKKEIAEHYRKALTEATGDLLLSPEEAHAEVARRLRAAADKMDAEVENGGDAHLDDAASAARGQAVFMEKQGADGYSHLPAPSLTAYQVRDIIARYGNGRADYRGIVDEPRAGQTYKVEIPEADELLDHDAPLSQQSERVRRLLDDEKMQRVLAASGQTGKDITGRDLYLTLVDTLPDEHGLTFSEGGDEMGHVRRASEFLRDLGIPGLRYLARESRKSGEGARNYVIWSEDAVQVLETLYQPGDDGGTGKDRARGWIEMAREGMKRAMRVFLTEKSDLSTFLHESAHTYLEMLGDLAQHPDADQRIREDYASVLKWLGVNVSDMRSPPPQSDKKAYEKWVAKHRAAQEKWAHTFEAYLLEGKAPSSALAESFQAFKLWLTQIYKTIVAIGTDVDLNDEIRGVFDRMLASDAEIDRMRQAAGLDRPPFRNHIEAGMTPAEWEQYQRDIQRTYSETAYRTQRAVAEAQARATKAYATAEFKKLRAAAQGEWDLRPDFRALRFVYRGEKLVEGRAVRDSELGKLRRDEVVKVLGDKHPLVTALHKAGRLTKDGSHPTEIAKDFGFESGREMLEAMAALPAEQPKGKAITLAGLLDIRRTEWVQQRAEQLMRERHPDLEGETARLDEMVQRLLHNEGTSDWLLKEWASLKRKAARPTGPFASMLEESDSLPPTPVEAFQKAAAELVAKRKVGKLDLGATLNRERMAAERAAMAAAKGNFRLALLHKQQQLLEHYKYREIDKAIHDREQFEQLVKDMNGDRRRALMAKASKRFLDASDQVLEALGARQTDPSVPERASLESVLAEVENSELGAAFSSADLAKLVREPPEGGVRELTIEQMRLVRTALTQLYTMARDKHSIIVDGKRVELEVLVDEIAQEAEQRPDLGPAPPQDEPRHIKGMLANLLEPREALRRLGKTAFNAIWVDGRIRAEKAEDELVKSVGRFFADQWDALPKELQARRFDLLEDLRGVPWPEDVDRKPTLDRQWMWMIALNMGNRSNMDRLLGGYRWSEEAVRDWLGRNMAPAEWDFIEGVWRLLDKDLFPKVSAVYEEDNGLPPQKIEALPFEVKLPDGKTRLISGGYFPARYDAVASRVGGKQALEALEKNYHQQAGAISVARSFTKKRADRYEDVIRLEWGVVPGHIMSVVHYVAFNRFVRSARTLMTQKRFAEVARHRIGAEVYDGLIDGDAGWLAMASSAMADAVPRNLASWYHALGLGKAMLVTSSIGWSVKTAAADIVEPLVSIMTGKVRTDHLLWSLSKAYTGLGFVGMRREAFEKSHALRHRSENARRKVRSQMEEIGAKGRRRKSVRMLHMAQESAFWVYEQSDKFASTIIWDAAYRQGLARGLGEEAAIAAADDVIESAMPTQDTDKKPGLLRDKRMGPWLMFLGYFSKKYSQAAETMDPALVAWANADGAGEHAKAAGSVAFKAGQVVAMLAVAQLLGELISGRGPEKDEEPPEWIARKMLAAPLMLFPFLSGIGEWASGGAVSFALHDKWENRPLNVRGAPALEAFKRIAQTVKNAADEDRDDDQRFWDILELAGIPLMLPPGSRQGTTAARYLTDLAQGEATEDPVEGVIYGERDGAPANPLDLFE